MNEEETAKRVALLTPRLKAHYDELIWLGRHSMAQELLCDDVIQLGDAGFDMKEESPIPK
jgi:hypothetical protein